MLFSTGVGHRWKHGRDPQPAQRLDSTVTSERRQEWGLSGNALRRYNQKTLIRHKNLPRALHV
jgi:hypothetical protein